MRNDFKVGQTWLSRDSSEKFTIINITNETKGHPVIALNENKKFVAFTRDGYFIDEQFPSPSDLKERL
jgi:hypothetical protein